MFAQLGKAKKNALFVGKLEIENVYHHSRLPEHPSTLFGVPPKYTGEEMRVVDRASI